MSKTDNIRLAYFDLPIIKSMEDFSNIIHISAYSLYRYSINADTYYKVYSIPKKSGGERQISQPCKQLKGIQLWILHNILYKLKVSTACKGFQKTHSTKTNVEPHKLSNVVMAIDLKDFFPTIHRSKVYNVFKAVGYNSLMATVLTNLCTYKEHLPQGSPCSPRLANLISMKLDIRIQGYVGKRSITYTRYADDLTFSAQHPLKLAKTLKTICSIANDEGFTINKSKTRIMGNARAKIITGLVLNDEGFGIGHRIFKQIRSKINHMALPAELMNTTLLNEANGWLSYISSVDEKRFKMLLNYIKKLIAKHPLALVSQLNCVK